MFPLQCSNHPMCAFSAVTAILLLFPAATSQAQILKKETYFFGPFNQSDFTTLTVLPSAAINLGALQVTPDSTGNVSLANQSGRIFFSTPFTLWDDENLNGKLVSFFRIWAWDVAAGNRRRMVVTAAEKAHMGWLLHWRGNIVLIWLMLIYLHFANFLPWRGK